jgi:hypothetical protein
MQAVKETAVMMQEVLMFVGAVGSLLLALDFLRPAGQADPFAGCRDATRR